MHASFNRWLIVDTSHHQGCVALAEGALVLAERRLDEARRHARDLAPTIAELLAEQKWGARDLSGVIVSLGPGSYTGLRVGVMSAKTLAYARGCVLLGVETFHAIARQAPPAALKLSVVADAQQEKLYVQRFVRPAGGGDMQAAEALSILPWPEWQESLESEDYVTGPGLEGREERLPACVHLVAPVQRLPRAESLLRIGLERHGRGERDAPFTLEPLYLRPSAAEEKWQAVRGSETRG